MGGNAMFESVGESWYSAFTCPSGGGYAKGDCCCIEGDGHEGGVEYEADSGRDSAAGCSAIASWNVAIAVAGEYLAKG